MLEVGSLFQQMVCAVLFGPRQKIVETRDKFCVITVQSCSPWIPSERMIPEVKQSRQLEPIKVAVDTSSSSSS